MNKWYYDALMVNRDPDWVFALNKVPAEKARQTVLDYFGAFTGYGITDLALCVYEQSSVVPCGSLLWRGDKYLMKEEKGIPVDYSGLEGIYRYYREYDIDPVEVYLSVMKDHGIRPWIAFRMNDAHENSAPVVYLRDQEFFDKAAENGWMIGEEYGYYAHNYNFAAEPVRKRMLDYIAEIAGRYDAFGFELDFMREIYCFDFRHDHACCETMTGFIRDVRKILNDIGAKRGHDIKLSVRLARSAKEAKGYGFDAAGWAKERLVDVIVPTARWECTDSGIPVKEWREVLGDEVALIPGVETRFLKSTAIFPEISKAYAAAWYAEGADGFYLNNHDYTAVERNIRSYDIHRKTALEGLRRYVVTYQDITSLGELWHPLPMAIPGSISVSVGPITKDSKAKLIIDFDGDTPPAVTVNGVSLHGPKAGKPFVRPDVSDPSRDVYITENPLSYDMNGIVTDGQLDIVFDTAGTVKYIEVSIGN